jgi:metal-responsive CopG/Arc/MetJ family transcriptional regulator
MQQIAIRLPTTLIDEIDEMVAELKADPLARAERSAVIRSLLQTALEQRRSKKRKQ